MGSGEDKPGMDQTARATLVDQNDVRKSPVDVDVAIHDGLADTGFGLADVLDTGQ
jgi:hypothetical protein